MEQPYTTQVDDEANTNVLPAANNLRKEDSYRDVRSVRRLNLANRCLQNPKLLRQKSLAALKNALQTPADTTGFRQLSGTASVEFPKEELAALLKKYSNEPSASLDNFSQGYHPENSASNNTQAVSGSPLRSSKPEETAKDHNSTNERVSRYFDTTDILLESCLSAPSLDLDENLTAVEQKDACLKEIFGLSNTLIEDTKDMLNGPELPEEAKSTFRSLITEFENDVEMVSNTADKIKPDLGNPRDWNAEYHDIMEIRPTTIEEKLEKFKSIAKLSQEFEYTAQLYGKIIISEVYWQTKYRTIRPFAAGGTAGGEKYVYNGILFKFATDWKGIYKNDRAAMKAASHEILSLMSIQDAEVEGIYTPLMCLVDYLGFRLVAISLLPVTTETLIYGSNDGGRTVCASNDEFNKKMTELGNKLNLAEHEAGMETHHLLSMPVDIEGHLGEDKRFYILDTARVMPPTFPDRLQCSFLFRLFRPEFVKSYAKPLSSDACSSHFDMHDPNRAAFAEDIRVATGFLVNSVIPKAVVWLDRHAEKMSITAVLEYLHTSGINFRYLPVVRKNSQSAHLKIMLLLEIVARGIKNTLWASLRNAKRTLKSMAEQLFKELIVNCCNFILGTSDKALTETFWQLLHGELKKQFVGFPTFKELLYDLRDPRTKYAFAIAEDVCPSVKYGELNVPMVSHKCFTCSGSEEICSVCITTCHISLGHQVSVLPKRLAGFTCSCSQHVDNCCSAKRHVKSSLNDDTSYSEIDNPMQYIMRYISHENFCGCVVNLPEMQLIALVPALNIFQN